MEDQNTDRWQLRRREVMALIMIISALAVVNSINLVRNERARHGNILIVEQGNIEISLNAASPAQLTEVPGIGPVLARRIVEYREQKGGFRTLEELKEIRGIGDNTFQKICPYLELGSSE